MAQGFSQLVNNITGSLESLGADLGILKSKGRAQLHPKFPGIISELNQGNWNKAMHYSFGVVGPGDVPFGEFVLPLNPTNLNQDETFAIALRPTQGGTVVNHGGNRYKDLVIKGTTGIAPFRGAGGVQRSTGKAIFQPDELKFRSGYEVFTTLKNWFKAYYQWKNVNNDALTKQAKLIFRNFKDGEFLIVELLKFSWERNAQRKFLYDYTLTFKVLSHLEFRPEDKKLNFLEKIDAFIEDAKDKIDTARGIFLRSQDMLRQIEGTYENAFLEPLRKISLATKAFLGVGTVAADMGKKIVSSTVTEADSLAILLGISEKQDLSPADKANVQKSLQRADNQARIGASSNATNKQVLKLFDKSDLLMNVDSSILPASSQEALEKEIEAAKTLPRSFYANTIDELKRVRDNAADKFNLGSSTYNDQYDRVATVIPETGKIPTDQEIELLAGFNLAIKALENLLASNSFFAGTYGERIEDIQNAFGGLLSLQTEQAVRQVGLPVDTDLERLALQELGDSSRWVEIAELNDLKPPYIIQDKSDTTEGVLHPGDKVLIPTPIVNGFGTTPRGRPTYFTKNLSEVEKNLGVDFKLSKDFDLILSNKGDLELAVGTANAAQAIMLNLMYEPGDLIKHPQKGVGVTPGSKFPSMSEILLNMVRSMTQDPRFESVEDIQITRKGSALYLNFTVKIKNVDIPVPASIRL